MVLKVRQGIQGVQGVQGRLGFQGLQGRRGPQGAQGSTGIQGDLGFQGTQGRARSTRELKDSTGVQGDYWYSKDLLVTYGGVTFEFDFSTAVTAQDPTAGKFAINTAILLL